MTPAQVAQMLGVAESDVMASLDAGDLKGTQDRHAVARDARRGRRVPQGLTMSQSVGRRAALAVLLCAPWLLALPAPRAGPAGERSAGSRARLGSR